MKITCITLGTIFLIFTYLQHNDATQYKNGDWWSWVIIYLGTAALSFTRAFRPVSNSLLWAAMGFALGGFVFRMQDEFGNFAFEKFAGRWLYDSTGTEMVQQTNEAGGLFIVALWLGILALLNKQKPPIGE